MVLLPHLQEFYPLRQTDLISRDVLMAIGKEGHLHKLGQTSRRR